MKYMLLCYDEEEAWNKALAEGRALSVEDTLAMVLK